MGSLHLGDSHRGRGKVHFKDIVEGENVREETDRVTGLTQMVIVESAAAEKRTPTVTIKAKKAGEERRYLLPTGAHLMVQNGTEEVAALLDRKSTRLNSSHTGHSYDFLSVKK